MPPLMLHHLEPVQLQLTRIDYRVHALLCATLHTFSISCAWTPCEEPNFPPVSVGPHNCNIPHHIYHSLECAPRAIHARCSPLVLLLGSAGRPVVLPSPIPCVSLLPNAHPSTTYQSAHCASHSCRLGPPLSSLVQLCSTIHPNTILTHITLPHSMHCAPVHAAQLLYLLACPATLLPSCTAYLPHPSCPMFTAPAYSLSLLAQWCCTGARTSASHTL